MEWCLWLQFSDVCLESTFGFLHLLQGPCCRTVTLCDYLHDWYIFLTLGFQKEVDSLLSVTKLSTVSDSKNTRKAREILLKLAEETAIFPTGWELSERYLFVVVSGCIFPSALILLSIFAFLFHIFLILTPPATPQYEVADGVGINGQHHESPGGL